MESYKELNASEVELTPEEEKKVVEAAIRKAKIEKAARLNMMAYNDRLKQKIEYPPISAVDFGKMVLRNAKQSIPGFILDEHNTEIFKLLCQYFTKDEDFEKAGFSLKKGLLLFGPIGCGKTTLMRLFMRNPTNDFVVKSCREVADAYTRKEGGGYEALEFYSDLIPASYPPEHYGQTHIGMCFDDLGTEKSKKHFGNEINVMEDVFQNRYDNRLIGKTHLTTNLSAELIGEIYGPRVRSRLREMCNLISFDKQANDRRK